MAFSDLPVAWVPSFRDTCDRRGWTELPRNLMGSGLRLRKGRDFSTISENAKTLRFKDFGWEKE